MQNDMKPQESGQKHGLPSGSGQAGGQASTTGGSAVSGIVDQAKHAASDIAETAKEKVESQVSAQKDRAVGSIGGVAEALRETGKSLRGHDTALPVEYVDRAAEQIERVGGYLRSRTLGELVTDVERFARREPAIFLGGAFTVGLLAARFLKSSSHHDDSQTDRGRALTRRDEAVSLRDYARDDEGRGGRSSQGTP
jgi:hypothetical protein